MEGSSGRAGVLGADGGFTRQQAQSTTAVILHEAARLCGEYSEVVAEFRLCSMLLLTSYALRGENKLFSDLESYF